MAASVGEHARLSPGSVIQDRFTVLHELGCGNFAKVYCCRDTKRSPSDPELVAVKILKKEYANDARYEADVLKAITSKNTDRRHAVLTVEDHFQWGRYPAFVFPLKGPTLRQRRMGVARGGYGPDDVRSFTQEMLRALAFLHFDVRMIHTDLKPENILLDAPAAATSAGASPTGIGSKWVIADFGSASFYRPERLDSDLISTRPYRAPEVVLGGSWFYATDMWSMGCIVFEVLTGARLFDVHDDVTHLSQMEARCGAFPECLASGLRHSRRFFTSSGKLMGRVAATSTPPLSEALRNEPLLADLLSKMLALDPKERIRADRALSHPYFDGTAPCRSASRETSASPSSVALPLPAARRTSLDGAARALPASRAASPLLPAATAALAPVSHVTTNSYTALKYAKLRRGMSCGPPMPPARVSIAEAVL